MFSCRNGYYSHMGYKSSYKHRHNTPILKPLLLQIHICFYFSLSGSARYLLTKHCISLIGRGGKVESTDQTVTFDNFQGSSQPLAHPVIAPCSQ